MAGQKGSQCPKVWIRLVVPGSASCCSGGPVVGPRSTSLTLPVLSSRAETLPAAPELCSAVPCFAPSPSASWRRPFSRRGKGDRDPQTHRDRRSAKAEETLQEEGRRPLSSPQPWHYCCARTPSLVPCHRAERQNVLFLGSVMCMPYLSLLRDYSAAEVFVPHFCFYLMAPGCHQQLELSFFLLRVEGMYFLKAVHISHLDLGQGKRAGTMGSSCCLSCPGPDPEL